MLNSSFGSALHELGPLVVIRDTVYIKTLQKSGPATLVSAFGVTHPLRRFCATRTLREHCLRANRPMVSQLLKQELAQQNAAQCTDALVYFLTHLAPAFQQRDWHEDYLLSDPPADKASGLDPSAQFDAAVRHFPAPQFPVPSLWVLGRTWLLAETPPVSGRVQVRFGGTTLGLTGDYLTVNTLESDWRAQVQQFVAATVTRLLQETDTTADSTDLTAAKNEISRNGALQVGDLLFITGEPPRLGYVIPPHFNRSLGYHSERDLALTAPLTLPPQIGGLDVYRRDASRRWNPASLPHGLCLGSGPARDLPDTQGLALAAYLRWAALRVAGNGRFHEHDN